MKVTTLYFLPPIVADPSVASLFAAWRRNPYGVSQIGSWFGHGVFAAALALGIGRVGDALDSHRRRVEVNRAGFGFHLPSRPRRARVVRLPERVFHAGTGELNRLQLIGAHRFRGRRDDALGVLRAAGKGGQRNQRERKQNLLHHTRRLLRRAILT
jgi:hypothetical protein